MPGKCTVLVGVEGESALLFKYSWIKRGSINTVLSLRSHRPPRHPVQGQWHGLNLLDRHHESGSISGTMIFWSRARLLLERAEAGVHWTEERPYPTILHQNRL
jgi:hypothetical protein